MTRYLVVLEPTDTGFSAYSPDLPGCLSTGRTREEVEANMREAIEFHVDGLRREGYPVPEPSSESVYIDLPASAPAVFGSGGHLPGGAEVRREIETGLTDSLAGRSLPVEEVRRRFGLAQSADARPAVVNVMVTADSLAVELADGRTLSVPSAWYPRLSHATPEERGRWRLIGHGEGIHWPDLDEDVSIETLLAGRSSGESRRSLDSWLERRRSAAL
jgi:predicted RNase H-like HicB family nuclease